MKSNNNYLAALVRLLVLSLAMLLLAPPQNARAAAGDLDQTFGRGGTMITDFGGTDDYAFAVKVQPDGKIIVAGDGGVYPVFHATLARYNANGRLDRTFGTAGKVTAALDPGGDGVQAIALQSDGKIVTAGSVIHNNSALAFSVGRFNADGSLDQSFGNGGGVQTTFGDPSAEGNDVILQTDGKIIVVGLTGIGSYFDDNNFALARYNADGTLDTSFGQSGKIVTTFPGSSVATSAALQSDGKFVVGGHCKQSAHQFCLARYNSDGTLDQTFGNFGEVTTPLGTGDAFAFSIALQRDGRIVLAGYADTTLGNDFALACYNSNGTLDQSFGNGGVVMTDFSGKTDDIAYSLAVQRDGKLVAGGRSGVYPEFNFALARYTSSGQLDQTFGSGGKVTTDFGDDANGYAITLQRDGKILLAGAVVKTESTFDFALARYLGR